MNLKSETCETYVVWKKWPGSVERDMFAVVAEEEEIGSTKVELL